MSAIIESLPVSEIGERLRIAREAAGLTQAAAAEKIDVARTTIVAIERGQRRIKTNELQGLCSLYGTSANAILRQEAVHLDMVPRFRKLAQSADDAAEQAACLLNDLVSAEVELENALGIQRTRNYPPERPILPGDVRQQAEQDAQDLRDWMGLGAGPVLDIVSLLDLQLGIRVYVRPLDGKISGLFAYDEAVGACMLLNAAHPVGRIIQTGAHELGHFNSARRQPEVLTEGEVPHSREERYADHFGRCFVTPARAVRQRFAEITAGQSHLTRRHIILLASAFGVAREAIVRRLEELGLTKRGTWDWFQANGGITDEQARQVLGELPVRGSSLLEAQGAVPPRLALLAREAWKRGFYSEGQLARLLKLDRHEVRELLDGAENEESEANELVKLPY
ncbi:helix-turn-helix domain-containing protein [Labrenzia sp. R5_0]|uniref:helix-turn-helix domain-containing protein n=1 Tax=Labrenzia sp. R5_0 TaxID=2821108 RepID=UPI001ADCCB76|nr:helix-turn-helix domain-containing protein [Labrenzia sp. R5_0]MBO9463286.1 helix-turn-helix domain-containing protein [Labrenzia sp. R5_0]